MKLSEWAKENNMSYITAWRRWKANKLPEGVIAKQTKSGSIIVEISKELQEQNNISEAIKKMYPEECYNIIDNDPEIKDLTFKLERKISQRIRGDEIDMMKEDIKDLKELVSTIITILEKNTIDKEEIDLILDNKEVSNVEKEYIEKKNERTSRLYSGMLKFKRTEFGKSKPKTEKLLNELKERDENVSIDNEKSKEDKEAFEYFKTIHEKNSND